MKLGATIPTVFAKQRFIFPFIVIFYISFCSFLTSNAQISGGIGVHTNTPNSLFEVNGSFGQNITTVTTTGTTLGTAESIVICNNGSTAITETLPTAVGITGRMYTIKKGTGSMASVTIDADGTETIDGALTLVLTDDQGAVTIVSDGAGWKVMSKYLSPFPMGEISYFSTTGTQISISATTNGNDANMYLCNPITAFASSMDFSSNNAGRLIYIGPTTRKFHIACTLSTSAQTTNDEFIFAVAKNGAFYTSSKIIQRMGTANTDAQSTAIHVVITLATNDYLELYGGNLSGNGTLHQI
ncbi:MAG: hypothetical protein WCI49_16530, partial [Ferruginibacter sp.]